MTKPTFDNIGPSELRLVILGARRLTRYAYRRSPLWVLVRDLAAVGSQHAMELCRKAGLDPHRSCWLEPTKQA